jgi:DNA-binding winged helix-turn-helix (wHTH) protein/TolB-like protein
MDLAVPTKLRIGDWCVDPAAGQISRGGEVVRVEARTLRLLLALAERPGEAVSIDELLDRVWAGVIVTPDSVYQAVASLRRLLGDDPRRPRYIANVPRLGYRIIAEVGPWPDARAQPPAKPRRPVRALVAAAVVLVVAAGLVARPLHWRAAAPPGRSPPVGVAPFVDLTPSMDQEQLADEMTEGVADRLSRNPRVTTPGFRSSFYLIGKHATLAEAARRLSVAFVVDGSVRRNGERVRVAARLVRADTGLVVWSQTWEGPLSELPGAQDRIAGAVAQALAAPRAGR